MEPRRVLIGWLAVALVLLQLAGCASGGPTGDRGSSGSGPTSAANDGQWRWVGMRDVEVRAPAAWGFDYDALRPDCIDPQDPNGPWAKDVPTAPYVTVGGSTRVVPAIGCPRVRRPGDPPPAFGQLPFRMWQPFVRVALARPNLDDPSRTDGRWRYRGWTLTRGTARGVQVTVLAPPSRPALGRFVLGSARRVRTNAVGCPASSPVQGRRFTRPSGPPVPPSATVAAVAVCEYSRAPGPAGLEGSRRISGPAARDLTEALRQAPRPGGPDRPHSCVHDQFGDRAITLRFFDGSAATAEPLAEAYVYFDWCFGNGIVDSAGTRSLTRDTCAPLFARPPIALWSAQAAVARVCGRLGPG